MGLVVVGTKYNYLQKLLAFFSFIIFVFFYTLVNAYVIPGPHLLELMIEKLGRVKSLLISQKLSLYDVSPEKNIVELRETLKYNFPEEFRSDIQSENAKRIYVFSSGIALTIIDNKIVSNTETRFDCYKDVMLYRSRILLQNRLSILGVDVSVSSLGRFKDKIAYVIGAEYPDEAVSQLWLDKNTFQPVRWIIIDKENKSNRDVLEIRYGDWKHTNKAWYPMHIEFYHNDTLVREIYADKIKVNPSFSEELFDIEYLKSTYLNRGSVEQDEEDSQGLSDIQKTIKEFKKLYE
ncbi:MAG: outer membrane lipoprotein-sorting protein [Proteobacteria bacterium]|nr:outer membrane lipoprotein-sorting protein [Pseudomonadota bacterium]MBU4258955.1 outer membrane lipoprotein-sorting protein [Pseudomonadota bacterium]